MIMASWPAVRFALPFSALSQYSMRAFGRARNVRSCPVSEGIPAEVCAPGGEGSEGVLCERSQPSTSPRRREWGGFMTLAEFRAQRDRRATEEAKRVWVREVSDPESLPEGMMRFTVYECAEPGLGVIIDRYLDLELIYDQGTNTLHD